MLDTPKGTFGSPLACAAETTRAGPNNLQGGASRWASSPSSRKRSDLLGQRIDRHASKTVEHGSARPACRWAQSQKGGKIREVALVEDSPPRFEEIICQLA